MQCRHIPVYRGRSFDGPRASDKAVPRDNVVFEAGYFTSAKGKDHVLIIRETGAKMPADLGGDIFASLQDKSKIAPIWASCATRSPSKPRFAQAVGIQRDAAAQGRIEEKPNGLLAAGMNAPPRPPLVAQPPAVRRWQRPLGMWRFPVG